MCIPIIISILISNKSEEQITSLLCCYFIGFVWMSLHLVHSRLNIRELDLSDCIMIPIFSLLWFIIVPIVIIRRLTIDFTSKFTIK